MPKANKSRAVLEEENDALRFELAGLADELGRVEDMNRKYILFANQMREQRDTLFNAIKVHRETLQLRTEVDSRLYKAVVSVARLIAARRKRCEEICGTGPEQSGCRGDCVIDGGDVGDDAGENRPDECWPHG